MALGRSLSMGTLINEGILDPGEKVLTFDYMGKRYEADLLSNGLIAWNGSTYTSPYAWASQCKNLVNPDHKSGIGWGHIRYKGIKLSQYKNVYMKKHKLVPTIDQDQVSDVSQSHLSSHPVARRGRKRKHKESSEVLLSSAEGTDFPSDQPPNNQLPNNQFPSNQFASPPLSTAIQKVPNTAAVVQAPGSFLECAAFETLGFQQPFTVSLSSNVLLLMEPPGSIPGNGMEDFHSHLSISEVCGYLAGQYDPNLKCLEVLQAFPCRCDPTSMEQGTQKDKEIQTALSARGLRVVGWYHSHPVSEPQPSHSDVLAQKSYQEAVRGGGGEEPCIGIITGPNHAGRLQGMESLFRAFWVLTLQQDGTKVSPMELSYSVNWEQYLTQDVVDEMNALATYYKPRTDYPKFRTAWRTDVPLIQKLKLSLSAVQPKFPQENSDETFMSYIEQLLL